MAYNKENNRPPSGKRDRDVREKAKQLMKNALHIRSKAEEDIEAFLADPEKTEEKNWGCFFLQQSIELALKGMIKYQYEYFQEFHYVSGNAQMLLDMSGKHPELREIANELTELTNEDFSGELNRWEAVSRYYALYAYYKDIKKANKISKIICDFIRRQNYLADD